MKNVYKHSAKVGNHGDVLKHVVWIELLKASIGCCDDVVDSDNGGIFIVDTHAGNGKYNLLSGSNDDGKSSSSYNKNGAASGIIKILEKSNKETQPAPTPVQEYLDMITQYNKENVVLNDENSSNNLLHFYPGSPIITRRMIMKNKIRANSELVCFELNESHCQDLKKESILAASKYDTLPPSNIIVHHKNGLAEAPALVFKNQTTSQDTDRIDRRRRLSVILIDPPYTDVDEETCQILETIKKLHTSVEVPLSKSTSKSDAENNHITTMLWIPILSSSSSSTSGAINHNTNIKQQKIQSFCETIQAFVKLKSIKALNASMWFDNCNKQRQGKGGGLVGSRVMILNPPSPPILPSTKGALNNLESSLETAVNWLSKALENEQGFGHYEIQVLG